MDRFSLLISDQVIPFHHPGTRLRAYSVGSTLPLHENLDTRCPSCGLRIVSRELGSEEDCELAAEPLIDLKNVWHALQNSIAATVFVSHFYNKKNWKENCF